MGHSSVLCCLWVCITAGSSTQGVKLCLLPTGVGQVPVLSWPNPGARAEDKSRLWRGFYFSLFSLVCRIWSWCLP